MKFLREISVILIFLALSLPLDTIHENDVDCAQNLLAEVSFQSKASDEGAKSVLDTLVEPPSAVGACASYFDTAFLFNNNDTASLFNLDDEPSHRLNRFIENMRLSPDYKTPNLLSPKSDSTDDKNRNMNRGEFNDLSSLQRFNIPKKREMNSGRSDTNIKWNENPTSSGIGGNSNLKTTKSNPLDYDRLKTFNFWTKVLYSTSPSCESINQNEEKRSSSDNNTDEENSKN